MNRTEVNDDCQLIEHVDAGNASKLIEPLIIYLCASLFSDLTITIDFESNFLINIHLTK